MIKQIIAIGGGGFSMEPNNPLLDLYFLQQTRKANPKICFVPTASGDSEDYLFRFYAVFSQYECRPSHLAFFRKPTAATSPLTDLEAYLLAQDAIYVGGGNTRSMLAVWREWGLDGILRKAWESGIVLGGISAGAICWFQEGLTDSVPGRLGKLSGL